MTVIPTIGKTILKSYRHMKKEQVIIDGVLTNPDWLINPNA